MTRVRKTDIPGEDRRVTLAEIRARGLAAVFGAEPGTRAPLVVEIGFGRGEFLRELARRAPRVWHLGVEWSPRRVFKMARRIARAGEGENLRLVCASGEQLLESALEDDSVQTFWVNFPDPWPKKRHHKKRLLQPPFVHQLAKRLAPGGALEVATDHADYAAHIAHVLRHEPLLENRNAAPFVREVPGRMWTAYETQWREEQRALHFFQYRRR